MSRMVVDLPEPEWPVRKANSPFLRWKDTSRSAYPRRGYSFDTWVSLITGQGLYETRPHSGKEG